MRAQHLVVACLLAHGCAPTAMIGGIGRAPDRACDVRGCESDGGTGSITIPLLVVAAVVTTPIVMHLFKGRS